MNAHGLKYFTSAATRDALIAESNARIRENALRREHARLVREIHHREAPQRVLKAEPETADATDRSATHASPSVGSMGAWQPADAGPAAA